MPDKRVCYVGGCGRLGYPMAVWTAYCGYETAIADIDGEAVRAVLHGAYESSEPMVGVLAEEARGEECLFATTNVEAAARNSDIVFVIVQTPSVDDGSFTAEHVIEACEAIGRGIRDADGWKVVSVASTVMPGTIEGPVRETLERASGKVAHEDFGLCCTPEFVRQGAIMEDFSCPDFIVVGCETDREWEALRRYFYNVTLPPETPILRMSVASAEIAKMGLNVAVVAKVARANELALLCHFTPGADADQVLDVIGRDRRIGQKYFSAGPPPGGPCFPRDSSAMQVAMRRAGVYPHVTEGVHEFDRYLVKRQADIVRGLMDTQGDKTAGILGLTYKPGVPLVVGSPAVWLARELNKSLPVTDVWVYDPAFDDVEQLVMEGAVAAGLASDLGVLVDRADVLVLMTPWEEFLALYDMDLSEKTVVDMWGFLPHLDCKKYVRFGCGA